MRRARWTLIPDDSGDRDGYWLRREGHLETFIPTEDLARIEALFRRALDPPATPAPGQPRRGVNAGDT